MMFMLKYAFTHIFFTAHTSLGCRNCLIGMLFDRKPDTFLSRTLYRTCVAAHIYLKVRKEDAMNDALFAPYSHYRESQQADWHTKQTLSRIKAESRRWSSRLGSHGMKPSDFDKCEICIHCKTTHKQDNKLYIIKTIFYFGFRTTISSLLFKKI